MASRFVNSAWAGVVGAAKKKRRAPSAPHAPVPFAWNPATHRVPNPWKGVVAHATRRPPAAPSAPSVPVPGGLQPGGAGSPGGLGDDAQAAAARAQALFERTQQVSALQQQGAYDAQDLAEALRRSSEQKPRDVQTTKENANRQGLFYSGILGKRLGDVETEYARREGDQRQEYQRREAARIAAIDALNQGAPLQDAGITAALLDRLTAQDVEAAGRSALVADPTAGVPLIDVTAGTPGVRKKPRPKTIVKRGKVFRLYPGRKPIYVRPAARRH